MDKSISTLPKEKNGVLFLTKSVYISLLLIFRKGCCSVYYLNTLLWRWKMILSHPMKASFIKSIFKSMTVLGKEFSVSLYFEHETSFALTISFAKCLEKNGNGYLIFWIWACCLKRRLWYEWLRLKRDQVTFG